MTPTQLGRDLIHLHRAGMLAGNGTRLVSEAAAEEQRRRECRRLARAYERLANAYRLRERATVPELVQSLEREIETLIQETKQ